MERKLHFLFFYFVSLTVFAQQTPKVTLSNDKQLKLADLKVNVTIIGNLAVTTYDMRFYNKLDRTLEGELVFPLGEGQVVSGFAMDVNGVLRDAVIVEKELARVAFETTTRRRIDPGLLEKTEGNNYKARVYPILPKNYKHIVLKFEQELSTLNGMQTYELPLGILEQLDAFSVAIHVHNEQQPIVSKTPYKDFFFKKSDGVYVANILKKSHAPTKSIVVQIPNQENQESLSTYNGYFQYNKALAPISRLKKKPKKVTILWDASYSMRFKNLDDELKLLTNYLEYLQNVKVTLLVFNNKIQKEQFIVVKKGNVETLIQQIKNTQYDGGTKLNVFKNVDIKADEVLLFSDGLANLGSFLYTKEVPVYTINSLVSSNHQNLTDIAVQSGGSYINLTRQTVPIATKLLKQEAYQFLGVHHDDTVYEVYPKQRTNVFHDFAITGQFTQATTIELVFGYGGKVTEKIPIVIEKTQGTKVVKRLWAKQKLINLNRDKVKNKQLIIDLAKQYDLITDYTSMLILDRLEDYVRYEIEPPKELMMQYKERLSLVKKEKATRTAQIISRKKTLRNSYIDLLKWYETDYSVAKLPKKINPITPEETTITVTNTTSQEQHDNTNALRNISGKVTDESGEPLSGVAVTIRGTTTGVTTDFDGNYSISVRAGDAILFDYAGYLSITHTISSTDSNLNIQMKLGAELSEVVVVGYGTQKRSSNVVSAISVIKAESMEQVSNAFVGKILQGKVVGLKIGESSSQLGTNSTITMRRNKSTRGNVTPLYVVDGKVVSERNFRKLKSEHIAEVSVLKNPSATTLYGSRGINGVIVITTKKGLLENKVAIDALEEKITNAIQMKPWNSNQPYIEELEKETSVVSAYEKYLEIRESYVNMPTFYLDVADFFHERKAFEIATTVITNLIEIELNNYELLKAMAYKLEYFERYDMAVLVYEKVLELRPEEPQSYRDLALAYEQIGAYQQSYDLLYKLYDGQLLEKDEAERFNGIEQIAFVELARLVSLHGDALNIAQEEKNRYVKVPVDIRITIDWNHNDTDIDLWVIDPNGEKAYYANSNTSIGGHLSNDLTSGYGPEEFLLKNAVNGKYEVYVNHFANSVQKISGPTILKVTLYRNYGTKYEQKEVSIVRLSDTHDTLEVGSLFFKKSI